MKFGFKIFNNSQEFIASYQNILDLQSTSHIFGSPYFLNYHTKINCYYIAFEKSGKLIAYLPYSVVDKNFLSHQGATYGGFVQLVNLNKQEIDYIYLETINYMKKVGAKTLTIRFLPSLFLNNKNEELNSYFKSKMITLFSEDEYYLTLDNNIKDIESVSFRKDHKRDIKNFAKTNFEIIEDSTNENIDVFYRILKENLKKHKATPTHTFDELNWLFEHLNNNFKLTLIRNTETYLAGSVKISLNNSTDYLIYASLNYEANIRGSLKYLYWFAAKDSFSHNKKYLTFGINNKSNEKKNVGLNSFKIGFRSNVILRDTYKLII